MTYTGEFIYCIILIGHNYAHTNLVILREETIAIHRLNTYKFVINIYQCALLVIAIMAL